VLELPQVELPELPQPEALQEERVAELPPALARYQSRLLRRERRSTL